MNLWRSEGKFGDLVVSFHHVALRDWNSGHVDWLQVPLPTVPSLLLLMCKF